jgi:hypothetical protein
MATKYTMTASGQFITKQRRNPTTPSHRCPPESAQIQHPSHNLSAAAELNKADALRSPEDTLAVVPEARQPKDRSKQILEQRCFDSNLMGVGLHKLPIPLTSRCMHTIQFCTRWTLCGVCFAVIIICSLGGLTGGHFVLGGCG